MSVPMQMKLPHVTPRRNRNGSTRYYFRRRGQPVTPLPGHPTDPEFMQAYQRCLNWIAPAIAASEGSFGWLCDRYMDGSSFRTKAGATRDARRRIILSMLKEPINPKFPERFAHEHARKITAAHIRVLRDRKLDAPNAANERLKILNQIFRFAMVEEIVKENPVRTVERLVVATEGHETATDADIARYFARHTSGPAFVAMLLLTEFGMRVSDLRRLGWQHVRNGSLVFDTFKTGMRCELPADPAFWQSLPRNANQLTFLLGRNGTPYGSDKSLSQMVSDWFDQAGCKSITAHSVRKWKATKFAENGWTENELMAWFGWRDPKEARPYTSTVNRRRLAESGKAKMGKI